jgi:hypothetical protein
MSVQVMKYAMSILFRRNRWIDRLEPIDAVQASPTLEVVQEKQKVANCALKQANCSLNQANCSLNQANYSLNQASCSLNHANCSLNQANCMNQANYSLNQANCSLNQANYSVVPVATAGSVDMAMPLTGQRAFNKPLK